MQIFPEAYYTFNTYGTTMVCVDIYSCVTSVLQWLVT